MNWTKLLLKPKQPTDEGFTLIELLVVIIIIGILSAVALPNLLSQVGVAREVEAKEGLSAISTAQQGHFAEKREFATTLEDLDLAIVNDSEYYTYEEPEIDTINDATQVTHVATAVEATANNTRNYAIAIYYQPSEGSFGTFLCQSVEPGEDALPSNTTLNECESGKKIE